MTGRFLIYGVTGYTGKLIASRARALGLNPILAGRNQARAKAMGESLGLEWRAFDLNDHDTLDRALGEVDAVLHVAGPFSATSRPMLDACLRTGRHYLDITGEIAVFEDCAARHDDAARKGIVVMPGVGFDVVPSDCLAAYVAGSIAEPRRLILAISGLGAMSRGTAKTGVEAIAKGTRVRRDGRIVALGRPPRFMVDFGEGAKPVIGVSWGDVSTAWHSTGVPDIEVCFQATPELERMAGLGSVMRWFLGLPFMQSRLKKAIDRRPEGPSERERASGFCIIHAEARNEAGEAAAARLRTPEGYTLTVETALDCITRVLEGKVKAGFQTPSRAFGANYILGFDGCSREDVPPQLLQG
jgi:short subunit dehydrogenase-like uncharacterized protein